MGTWGWIRTARKALGLHPTGSQAVRRQGSAPAFECKTQIYCPSWFSEEALVFPLSKHFGYPRYWNLPSHHPIAHGWSVLSQVIPGLLRPTSRHESGRQQTWQQAERWDVGLNLQTGTDFPSNLLFLHLIHSRTAGSKRLAGLLLEATAVPRAVASVF